MKKYYEFINNLPEFVNINGYDKPTTNNNGDFIYHSIEGIINFWNWFDDSVIIDKLDRPLIMYHGTQYDFDIFKTGDHFWNQVIPVYLSIKNPLRLKKFIMN